MGDTVIDTRHLSRHFGDVRAVEGLDLQVEQGEIFGLVGPDGAGKTTTIRMLTAILLPSAGQARVLGNDVVADPESIKGRVGYMAQRFNLYRDLTVQENLTFFADIFEVPTADRQQRIDRLLEFAGLSEFGDRRADHLSGGMQKKLALATTLVHEPEILFLDEPTTGVDPVSRREFWEILTDLYLQGITIFVSTPYMDEAERCSRVGLMYGGDLIQCDTPGRIRSLVPGELLEVRTPNPRRASAAAATAAGVTQVQTYGDLVHVFVDSAEERRQGIEDALAQAGIRVQGIRKTRPRMEEAFISLITAAEEQHGES
jgi:ABC-2 type transport system ATP-binding protein